LIRIILLVGRVDEGDDLGFVAEGFREERADGAIDLARGKDFLLAGSTLALDKATRNASAGIGKLAVLNGQREEVDAFLGIRRGDCGCENGIVAAGGEGRAGGLLGDASGFEFDVLATGELNRYFLFHGFPLFLFCL
jgi:hypothetical protein